jgi:hypothetical protein
VDVGASGYYDLCLVISTRQLIFGGTFTSSFYAISPNISCRLLWKSLCVG